MSLSREQKWEGIDRELTQLRDRKGNKRMKAVIKEMGICLTDCTSRGTSLKLVLRKQKDKRTEVTVVKQFVEQKELKFLKNVPTQAVVLVLCFTHGLSWLTTSW